MPAAVRLLLLLAGAVALQAAATALAPQAPRAVDLLLVAAVFHALDSGPLGGVLGGLFAGLGHDALSGGLYGLHGFAKTLVGYLTGLIAQRFMVHQPLPVTLVFAVAAALHEAVLTGLAVLLYARPEIPAPSWLLAKVASTAALGLALFLARARWRRQSEAWRRSRTGRLKLG
jgi:rod shape-determining protein MreD